MEDFLKLRMDAKSKKRKSVFAGCSTDYPKSFRTYVLPVKSQAEATR